MFTLPVNAEEWRRKRESRAKNRKQEWGTLERRVRQMRSGGKVSGDQGLG